MAKVTYHAPEGDEAVVTIGGIRFFDDQEQDVDAGRHDALLRKLSNNPHFKVEGFAPGPSAGVDVVDFDPKDAPEVGLRAIHNGGGRFIIVRGDKDQKVKDGLTKDDAKAFNDLSDEDKEAYVA